VYLLYREQYELPERMVAVLFVTGFMSDGSAGVTAPLVGVWADQQCVFPVVPLQNHAYSAPPSRQL